MATAYTRGDPRKQDVVSVKAYGAVGDGVADDTAAIQAAIGSLPAAGGSIYLPVGDYRITSPITVRSDLIIRGDGQDKTYIRQASTTADCLTGVDISYLSLADIQLFGPGSGSGCGLKLTRSIADATPKISLTNVVVYNFGSDGVDISNPIVSTFVGVSAIANGGHGFDLHGVDGGAAGTSVSMVGCYGNANQQAGYNLRKLAYSSLQGCAADHNGIGYLIEASEGITLVGCGCETPTNRSAGYPGIGYKVTGSTSVGLLNTWLTGSLGVGWLVTGSSTAVQLIGPRESAPSGGATAFVKVDAGSRAALLDAAGTTPHSLAAGTTTILNDGSGNLTVPGVLNIGPDTSWYRAAASVLQTDGKVAAGLDIECITNTKGLVLHDRSNGNAYRLKTTGGVLGVELAS